MIFVDTTAFCAFVDGGDRTHARARRRWEELAPTEDFTTHNYVLAELIALLQGRLGLDAVRTVRDAIAPSLDVVWVDPETHDAALEAVVLSGRRAVSLVDRVSFQVMRRLGITQAFAYDPHFRDEGFELLG